MSRKYRYNKNNNNLTMDVSGPPPMTRGRGRGRGQFVDPNGDSRYSQHDNRSSSYDNNNNNNSRPPRGTRSFRRGARGDLRSTLRANNNNTIRAGGRGGGSGGGGGNPNEESYKVTIPHGDKYEQAYLINLLRENFDGSLQFFNYQKQPGSAQFFVMGVETADTLRNLSRRITTQTGQRLVILTSRSSIMSAPLNDNTITTIRAAMSRLYDPNTKVMNLANFQAAEEFKQHGLFIAVGRANVLRTIVDTIGEYTPDLLALNLRENKLNFLESLRKLSEKCPSLKAIDLSQNRIHNFDEVNNLRDSDLVEVMFEGNPFVDDFTSQASYISSIRRIFKNLKKLDNEDLPSEIGFDLGATQDLPATQAHFFPNENVQQFVYQFLESYYKIFDSENRQALMQAYHDEANFTYCYTRNDNSLNKHSNDQLTKESHNLLRLRDESLWVKYVRSTSIDIVSFLGKFPMTQHDADSFHIDVPFMEPKFVIVVVSGLYTETYKTNKPLRSFSRTFFIVPQGAGYVIVNDMLQISNPSNKQSLVHNEKNKQNNRNNAATRSASDGMMADVEFTAPSSLQPSTSFNPIIPSLPSQSSLVPPPSQILSPPLQTAASPVVVTSPVASPQEQLLLKFMQVTSMNRSYSQKCLSEFGYDGDKAFEAFQMLKAANQLPPDAFI